VNPTWLILSEMKKAGGWGEHGPVPGNVRRMGMPRLIPRKGQGKFRATRGLPARVRPRGGDGPGSRRPATGPSIILEGQALHSIGSPGPGRIPPGFGVALGGEL